MAISVDDPGHCGDLPGVLRRVQHNLSKGEGGRRGWCGQPPPRPREGKCVLLQALLRAQEADPVATRCPRHVSHTASTPVPDAITNHRPPLVLVMPACLQTLGRTECERHPKPQCPAALRWGDWSLPHCTEGTGQGDCPHSRRPGDVGWLPMLASPAVSEKMS